MIKFGTGGWRAIIGEDFTKSNLQLLSQGLANRMIQENADEFVIGYDRRFLSEKSAQWMAEVMAGNGIKVYFINKIAPTPMIMFSVKEMKLKYGAAITASHNPADYNGIKIFTEGGRDASAEVTNEIEVEIRKIEVEDIKVMNFDKAVNEEKVVIYNPFNDYIDTIINMTDLKAIKDKQLKILLDPMYGVSKTSLQTILMTARCEVELIHDRHDTLFGGRLPSPSAETLGRLKNDVVEKGFDLGIGTDGDADRLGIIDEKGNFIHPNEIMALLYYYLLKYKKWTGPVVRNLATTHLLDKIAEGFGEECYEVPVGFKHISSKMEETNALIGGESSGGLTIRGHIKGKDGVFAASLLVEMISVTNKHLSKLLDEIHEQFGKFEMAEHGFGFDVEEKERLLKILYTDKKIPEFSFEVERVSYMDGVKVFFKNGGWIIARFSGTEPLLRVFAEMDCMDKAEIVSKEMKEFLGI
ncbi:phosphoglucomutase/phosphomannomutase family protein [Vallitalea guaymasensis]|uniref:phosphoglucomutase/phosphomannomutase family protein n=1 Tax=Vallitalea guaymasensis TaxID=1185412 RepID=UPI000DE3E1CD|nr:phosphoglucomutase/phosphomannomutase family protein [Vallitalea guaymasensis]